MREAARKLAAPFWKRVEGAQLDRFFVERLLRALLRRWREDRFARVKQGGFHGDSRAELSRVFIDLDATPGGGAGPGGEGESERIVASWTRPRRESKRARLRQRPPGFDGDSSPRVTPSGLQTSLPFLGGFEGFSVPLEVVLGGPGQGKSTVGRFLVLIHAAILLVTSPIEGIAAAAEIAQLEALLVGLSAEEIALPDVVRLPVWIELRELVDALLRDEESEREPPGAMLRWYAATELREGADVASIETALTSLPWVMVLDGLDEVPPERGRALVRACIAGVRHRFASSAGRVIATSRPGSYEREVFGDDLVERTLLPLKPERATLYAERFVESLLADEDGKRAALLKHLRKALTRESTAALMSNPLLVTIMAAIVIHQGEPSDRRWTLFEEYYSTLYRRETERDTYASATLREHAALICAIHQHVGMSLQARSEEAAGVSALMPEHELRALIREHLVESYPSDEAARLTDEILHAAEQRLVLLVQSQEGMYGFDLRSFQEFMAAWQVLSLPEAQGGALLRRLAPLAAWRNVVLFVIGGLHARSSPLARERSVGLCDSLDNLGYVASRVALPGARLALAVLGDAPYGKAPKPRRELVGRALELLRIPPSKVHEELGRRLWDIEADHLLAVLDEALLDPARRGAAWATLLALPDDEQVKGVAERHWPGEQGARREIVRSHARRALQAFPHYFRHNPWLSRKVAQDLTLTRPEDLWLLLAPNDRAGTLTRSRPIAPVEFRAPGDTQTLNWYCGSVAPLDHDSSSRRQDVPRSSDWAARRAEALFREDVSARRLAEVLEELAGSWEERSAWHWNSELPWPLLACVMAAQSAEDLRGVAGRLRRGELGDLERWHEIEGDFGNVGPDRLKRLAASTDPLRAILLEGVMPPFDAARGSFITHGAGSMKRGFFRDLDGTRRAATSPWVARMLGQLMLGQLDISGHRPARRATDSWPSVDEYVDLVNTAESELNIKSLDIVLPSSDPVELAAIFTRTTAPIIANPLRKRLESLHTLLEPLTEALRTAPDAPRLQRALVVVLQHDARRRRAPLVNVDPVGDTLDAWLLRFVSGRASISDAPTLARLLIATADNRELESALHLLAAYPSSHALVLPVVEALLACPDAPESLRSTAVEFIATQLAGAPAGLASPAQWTAAGLPAPPPMPDLPEQPALPGAHISSIEISNLRAFPQRFEVKVPVPEGPGQWMVFLGENATGKTTLLRAVAMALASPSEAVAVPSNLEGPLRRDASRDGLVRVLTRDGRDLMTTVTGPAGDERVVVGSERTPRPWVVGYGCRRGSAISGTDMDNAFAPFRDLDNLFDRPRGVIRASGWLKELQRRAKNNGTRSRMVFEAARAALRKVLLGAENVRVENEVHVDFEDRRQVPLALLSDGYLTTAGWVVDLMARWLERNEASKTVDENFCAEMEGVVLLDEIDLHLHPRWQERVIEDVRTLFPRMTFIATTHHPLTLRGARKGEVFVLDEHETPGAISALQRDIPPGTRVDELLTGTWFNRPSAIVDADTRKMLDEHQRLILAGAKAGDPERKALEVKLRERLGRYADTSLERLAATIVAQHLDKDLPEPSAQKREEVRAQVLKILERRDAKPRDTKRRRTKTG